MLLSALPPGALSQNEAILLQKRTDFETREAASEVRRRQMDEERRAADERKRLEEESKQAERKHKYELSLQREEARKQVGSGWAPGCERWHGMRRTGAALCWLALGLA